MKERLIIKTSGIQIMEGDFVRTIVGFFYRLTGNKISIIFNGSKGYLDNIELSCEGNQKEGTNIINLYDITLKRNQISKKQINIFYSEENGIRVSLGKLLPTDPKPMKLPF
ncbi:hypothetical protein IF125_04245 [Empedobacter stercoris]|uniref:hypothetical protein n=1 Tax=Empedobacter stercoris TaxID=1628248 RepID=UPI001CE09282|nr:hypothetical protein [Empedobacter stercoris]MCA4781473.1 hypothetical protein [Empedobacter stercoris]